MTNRKFVLTETRLPKDGDLIISAQACVEGESNNE